MSFLSPMLPALTAGAGLLNAVGQYQQGQQMAQAADFNSKNYERQASELKTKAAQTVEIGAANKASALSSMKSAYGFRGVKISGSPLLVMAEIAANLESDIRETEYNTLIGASQAESAAAQERMKARMARASGITGAAGALMNTGLAMSNFIKPATQQQSSTKNIYKYKVKNPFKDESEYSVGGAY